MSESFNPILVHDPMPARGFLGSKMRKGFTDVLVNPEPRIALVLQTTPGSDPGENAYEVLSHVSFESWKRESPQAARYFKVDLAKSVLVRDLTVPSRDDGSEFKATVIATIQVENPTRVVEGEVSRNITPIGEAIDEIVTQVAQEHGIDEGDAARSEVEGKLRKTFDCGIAVRWCRVVMKRDAASTERARALRKRQIENELQELQAQHDNEIEKLEAQHDQALFELRKDFDDATHRRKEALEKARLKHEQELADLQHTMEKAREDHRHELEDARRSHAAKLEDLELTTQLERRDAERRRELGEAKMINDEIAAHPDNVVGYLLALDNSKQVLDAVKLVEERRRTWWDRVKEAQKLEMFKTDEEFRARVMQELFRDGADPEPPSS